MALIFQRLAQNFIKNGYFPTDSESISRILEQLEQPEGGSVRVIDTCCGEGIALAECAHHFKEYSNVFSAGIEYDAERAEHASNILDHVVHSDINDCVIGKQQFNLLWLNPPYGDGLSAGIHQQLKEGGKGRVRLEKEFLSRSLPTLCYSGVLVYIIPHYILDKSLSQQLSRSLDGLKVFRLPEDRFKQVVVIGHRKRSSSHIASEVNMLMKVKESRESAPMIPIRCDDKYRVPTVSPSMEKSGIEVRTVRLTHKAVGEVVSVHRGLWTDFDHIFKQVSNVKRRPANKLSDWHLALMLAAGQVSGIVENKEGRRLLVKGGTHKVKESSVSVVETDDGIEEIQTLIDRFVPVIKALDVTNNSPEFGEIITVK